MPAATTHIDSLEENQGANTSSYAKARLLSECITFGYFGYKGLISASFGAIPLAFACNPNSIWQTIALSGVASGLGALPTMFALETLEKLRLISLHPSGFFFGSRAKESIFLTTVFGVSTFLLANTLNALADEEVIDATYAGLAPMLGKVLEELYIQSRQSLRL